MAIEISVEALKECFADLPDPRVVERTSHSLGDILFLTLCAVICGMDDWESIEVWGELRLDWLRWFVVLENGIPSHDKIARVFAALDSKRFQASLPMPLRRRARLNIPYLTVNFMPHSNLMVSPHGRAYLLKPFPMRFIQIC